MVYTLLFLNFLTVPTACKIQGRATQYNHDYIHIYICNSYNCTNPLLLLLFLLFLVVTADCS